MVYKVGSNSCAHRIVFLQDQSYLTEMEEKSRSGQNGMFFPLDAKNSFLPVLAPNHGGDLQYCEPDTLADGIKKCAASKYAKWLAFTKVFPGKDALDFSWGTASFSPTPLHITGLALTAVYQYLGREGRKKIHCKQAKLQYSHNTPVIRAMPVWAASSLFPGPEQQQDQDTNKRTESQCYRFPAS